MTTSDKTAKTPLPKKDPWPMWPIALAIVIFIVGYTYITFHYRKDGKAYEPFQAMQDRREEIVEKNFYDWYRLKTEIVSTVSEQVGSVPVKTVEQGGDLQKELPDQLVYYIPTRPVLLPGSLKIDSDAEINAGQPYKLRLELPKAVGEDERFHLQSFYKDGTAYLLASFFVKDITEVSEETLQSSKKIFEFHIPTEPIQANRVKFRLYSEGLLHTWSTPVKNLVAETPES